MPILTSTKSLTGHSQGATGVQEAIYTLIMMNKNFISANSNFENPDENLKINDSTIFKIYIVLTMKPCS